MKLVTFDDLGYLTLLLLRRRPILRWTESICTAIGDLDHLVRAGRRRYVAHNLRLFNSQLDGPELAALVRSVFRDRWASSGDVCYRAWRGSAVDGEWRATAVPCVDGFDRLQRALERGKGAILWESPFGSRERLHLSLLSKQVSFTQVHGAEHGGSSSWLGQNLIRPLSRRFEGKIVPEIVDIQEGAYSYLRLIKTRLAENRVVCMPGLGPKGRRAIGLDFLARKEHFATGVTSLAMSTGAAFIPVYSFEERPGKWRTVFEEPVDLPGNGDRSSAQAAAIQLYAQTLESYVRLHPEQWRRWYAAPVTVGKPGLPAVEVDIAQHSGGKIN
jgi:lauroyl/myristoyl acyltransferase